MQKEYITTNVRLPQEAHRQLKLRALQEEKSLAELIREAIFQRWGFVVSPIKKHGAQNYKDGPLWKLPKCAKNLCGKELSSQVNLVYQVNDSNCKEKKDFLQEMLKLAKPMGGKISSNIDNILYGKIRRRR